MTYRQYIGAIRETGELKASLEKMEGDIYHYVLAPSARNNTLTSINQETNSIDQIVQAYKGKKLSPEEEKISPISLLPCPRCSGAIRK